MLGHYLKAIQASPIHLHDGACRIWDEIVDVRIERPHDITEEDAIREGIEGFVDFDTSSLVEGQPQLVHKGWKNYYPDTLPYNAVAYFESPRDSYRSLWESINGKGSWATNPWVWRIETKAIPRPDFE